MKNVINITICNSKEIKGIQLSDLVAALCGVRLREAISGNPKLLLYGEESGFNPPIKADLGYELWASLRYSMSREPKPIGEGDNEISTFKTKGHGFFISELCSKNIKDESEKLFGSIYLGCIH